MTRTAPTPPDPIRTPTHPATPPTSAPAPPDPTTTQPDPAPTSASAPRDPAPTPSTSAPAPPDPALALSAPEPVPPARPALGPAPPAPAPAPAPASTLPDDRAILAWLAALAEPADVMLRRFIDALGPAETLATIRTVPSAAPRDLADHLRRTEEENTLGRAPGLDEETAAVTRALARWRARLTVVDPDRNQAACARLGARFIIPGDPEWPTQLNDLGPTRPYGLWLRGEGNLRFACLRSVSLVGSRAASDYGLHVALELAADLAERRWTIVSGGAYGIDARAHRGALAEHGTTIAVLACGADVSYPVAHTAMFDDIAANGVIVSEWPPGSRPYRGRFLVRNRVIAALTRGTVVIEAAVRSGALSTARNARELSRHVMAVPGPVTTETSRGCHHILREWGATCVTSADEVAEQIGLIGDDLAEPRRPPVLPRDRLGDETRRVLDAIPARGPGSGPATLAAESGVGVDATVACLGSLAAGGFIERGPDGWRLRDPRSEEDS